MGRQNFDLHMHTTYCDGNDSAEAMVKAAISKGLRNVGLSGHSFTPHDTSYCMSREGTQKYIEEVTALKSKYAEQINVLLGIELDYYADTDVTPFDYRIGSVHYMFTEEGRSKRSHLLRENALDDNAVQKFTDWCPVDDEPYDMRRFALSRGMDMLSVAELFYETAGDIVKQTDCDIIGHFDRVTKFNDRYRLTHDEKVTDLWGEADCDEADLVRFFDTEHPRYTDAWKQALDRIFEDCRLRYMNGYRNRLFDPGQPAYIGGAGCRDAFGEPLSGTGGKPVFEINRGAMIKGYKSVPYPAADQIKYIKEKGGILILSSDAHSTAAIASGFEEA